MRILRMVLISAIVFYFSIFSFSQENDIRKDTAEDVTKNTQKELIKDISIKYFNDILSSNYSSASKYIYPIELESFKDVLLPLLISISEKGKPEYSQMTTSILGEDKEKWQSVSSSDFFAAFLSYVTTSNKELADVMREMKYEVADITVKENEAILEYWIIYKDQKMAGSEKLILYENTWYFRMKQDPRLFEEKFKGMLIE
jgi:hypothetical protein